jgi:hypothetical protein
VLPWEVLEVSARALASARWARVGDTAVVSRCVHGHGAPGDGRVAVYLGMDAGRRLYGRTDQGAVLHADVLHGPGRCDPARLRRRLVEAARAFLAHRGLPPDETHRLLAWMEARVDTEGTLDESSAGPSGPSGHVHLAFRLDAVPWEFVPLALAAAEAAVRESGLEPLALEGIDATWDHAARPPCACGCADGPVAAGVAEGIRHGATGLGGPAETGQGPAGASRSAIRPRRSATLPTAQAGRVPLPGGSAARPVRFPTPRGTQRLPRRPRDLVPPRRGEAGARGTGTVDGPATLRAALLADGRPVVVRPAHLRWAARRPRRLPEAVVAVDPSASMAAHLAAARYQAERLWRLGHRVALWALPVDPGRPLGDGWQPPAPTRDPDALAAMWTDLEAAWGAGTTDLAAAFQALRNALADRARVRRVLCVVLTDALATRADEGDPLAAAAGALASCRGLARARLLLVGPPTRRLQALATAAGVRWRSLPPGPSSGFLRS